MFLWIHTKWCRLPHNLSSVKESNWETILKCAKPAPGASLSCFSPLLTLLDGGPAPQRVSTPRHPTPTQAGVSWRSLTDLNATLIICSHHSRGVLHFQQELGVHWRTARSWGPESLSSLPRGPSCRPTGTHGMSWHGSAGSFVPPVTPLLFILLKPSSREPPSLAFSAFLHLLRSSPTYLRRASFTFALQGVLDFTVSHSLCLEVELISLIFKSCRKCLASS